MYLFISPATEVPPNTRRCSSSRMHPFSACIRRVRPTIALSIRQHTDRRRSYLQCSMRSSAASGQLYHGPRTLVQPRLWEALCWSITAKDVACSKIRAVNRTPGTFYRTTPHKSRNPTKNCCCLMSKILPILSPMLCLHFHATEL